MLSAHEMDQMAITQQTGVLLQGRRKPVPGKRGMMYTFCLFFSLTWLAQIFQRSVIFWAIIKNFLPAEEEKGEKVCGLSQARQGLLLHRARPQEVPPLLLLLINTTAGI